MVRELLSEGANDDEVKAFFVARYGEVVAERARGMQSRGETEVLE